MSGFLPFIGKLYMGTRSEFLIFDIQLWVSRDAFDASGDIAGNPWRGPPVVCKTPRRHASLPSAIWPGAAPSRALS